MSAPNNSRRETWWFAGIFAVALIYSFYGVTYRWTSSYMAGFEFRQVQTAITTYYIDKDSNFGLLYETPIMGKPWVSILMEVPFYEWSVVAVSRATGWSHLIAARAVSAACFYLTLPALWLLLGRMAVARARRWLVLALVVSAPVYIYFSRAFLMDAMALLGSAWWLAAFVRTMDGRSWRWLAVAMVAGTMAALVKSAIFAVWLVPGAAYGAWRLWVSIRAGGGWARVWLVAAWGLATVVVPLGLLQAWIAYTDPLKAAHASAWIFTAKNLSMGNWGLFDFKTIFSAEVWRFLLNGWEQAAMSRWVIAALFLTGLCFRAVRWRVLGVGGVFWVAQLMFPFAYAYQDYYFYACVVFLNVAFGFVLLAAWDSRLPRAVVAVFFIAPFAAQVKAYWQGYRVEQGAAHPGGYPFDEVLRLETPSDSRLIIAGADWAAVTPYYAERKALMVRNGLEFDPAYLNRAFRELGDDEVSALIVHGNLRANREFIEKVTRRFDMEGAQPTFSFVTADVYVARPYAKAVRLRLQDSLRYPHLKVPPHGEKDEAKRLPLTVSPDEARTIFNLVSPAPYQADFQFGYSRLEAGEKSVLSVHPNSDLWVKPPPEAKRIEWNFGIFPGAYEKPDPYADGVEFLIYAEKTGTPGRRLYRQLLDPANRVSDRAEQHVVIPYTPDSGEVLRFATRPGASASFDWAYTIGIDVK